MITKTILHTRIRKKFGTISRFAELANHNRYELQKIFARKAPDKDLVAKLMEDVRKTPVQSGHRYITPEQRRRLKEAVTEYGGPMKFCQDNPQFNENTFFQIYSGRRKTVTPMVRELFRLLKLD